MKKLLILIIAFLLFSSTVLLITSVHAIVIDSPDTGLVDITFDNNNNLWVSSHINADGVLTVIDPNDGSTINQYNFPGVNYNGIVFDTNNDMYLLSNNEFMVRDSIDGIFFNGNDISNTYQWPFGRVGGGSMEPLGGDFDQNGNLIVSKYNGIYAPSDTFILASDYSTYTSFEIPYHFGQSPLDIAVGPDNNIYVSFYFDIDIYTGDTHNKVGGIHSSNFITGIAFDGGGQLWIADTTIDKIYTISEIPQSQPVPEPASLLLLGSGLFGLGAFRNKFKKN